MGHAKLGEDIVVGARAKAAHSFAGSDIPVTDPQETVNLRQLGVSFAERR